MTFLISALLHIYLEVAPTLKSKIFLLSSAIHEAVDLQDRNLNNLKQTEVLVEQQKLELRLFFPQNLLNLSMKS